MRRMIVFAKAVGALLGILLAATPVLADKIFLKNGRTIVAYSVVEDGDKIHYETSAGQMTLPRSIVDHVEKGGLMPMMESPAAAAANLNIAPPAMEPNANVEGLDADVVHDGAVDRGYVSKLEDDARSGSAKANERAAMAHHAAAQFEMSHGDLERALSDEQTALKYAPEQPMLLMNVAYVHLRRSEFKLSLEYLDKARGVAPQNAD